VIVDEGEALLFLTDNRLFLLFPEWFIVICLEICHSFARAFVDSVGGISRVVSYSFIKLRNSVHLEFLEFRFLPYDILSSSPEPMCKYDSFLLYFRFLGLGFSLYSVVFREFSHLERSSFYKALLSYWMRYALLGYLFSRILTSLVGVWP